MTASHLAKLSTEGITMLVLSRRPSETIQIGTEIEISVLEIRGNQVRLGISAPPDMLVLRTELAPAAHSPDEERANAPSY